MAGALDLTLENASLVLVTWQSWPPSSAGPTELLLLLVAGLAAYAKWALIKVAALALGALVVLVHYRCLRQHRPSGSDAPA